MRGRPKKYSKKFKQELAAKLEEYIEKTEIPVIAEFAYQNNIPRKTLYDFEEFSPLLIKLIDKKEAQLEIKSLNGEINSRQAIFSLKQLGWRDKQEIEHSGETTQNVNANGDLSHLTVEELKQLASDLSKLRGKL